MLCFVFRSAAVAFAGGVLLASVQMATAQGQGEQKPPEQAQGEQKAQPAEEGQKPADAAAVEASFDNVVFRLR